MRSGFVAIIGRPNVGKSSFVNRVVGTQLSAVSPRPQTTWHQIRGVFTDKRGQVVFVDTPGLHRAESALNKALVANAVDAAQEADAVLLLLDASDIRALDRELVQRMAKNPKAIVALNKIDLVDRPRLAEVERELMALGVQTQRICVPAGNGIDRLVDALFALLPEGSYLYDPEDVSDRSMRFVVGEYVRQAIFEQLQEELPYEAFVEIENYAEAKDPLHIEANIFVARESQKRIVIGKGGQQLKAIGMRARKLIEELVGRKVYLQLWVKVLPKWNKSEHQLRRAGVLMGATKYKQAEARVRDWKLQPNPEIEFDQKSDAETSEE